MYWIKSNYIENISCVTKSDRVSEWLTEQLQELLELLFATKKVSTQIHRFNDGVWIIFIWNIFKAVIAVDECQYSCPVWDSSLALVITPAGPVQPQSPCCCWPTQDKPVSSLSCSNHSRGSRRSLSQAKMSGTSSSREAPRPGRWWWWRWRWS